MTPNHLSQLTALIDEHTPSDGLFETAVPGLALYRSAVRTEHQAVVYVPSLCIVTQGAKEVVVGRESFRYNPVQSLLVSVDLPAVSRVIKASAEEPCLAVRIELDTAIVGELLADGAAAPQVGPPSRGLAITPTEPMLLGAVTRLVDLLNAPQDSAVLAPLIHREITYRLLTGPQGARLRQIAATGAPAQRIARAIAWLRDSYAKPASVESLAKRVGLKPSAFHLHFKSVTGLSPLQYQKRLRLQEARRLMLGDQLEAAEAAFRVGYESPSQFGREYRRMFGNSPKRYVASLAAD